MDITTQYLGLTLKNPVVVSPSPLSEKLENLRKMEDFGAGAVVLHSLFEEQIRLESETLDANIAMTEEHYAEHPSFFPDLGQYKLGPEAYLEHVIKAKAALSIPVIASLNGVSTGGWIDYAKKIQQAGADALELNIYSIQTDPNVTAADVEGQYVQLVKDVRAAVNIPVAVKLGPYFSAMANVAKRMEAAGANGLVLFNRFYQPDFDLEALEVVPSLQLSTSYELLLRLHWVAVLYGKLNADFAVTGGVHTSYDVLKAMMAGAKVAMMTSAVLKRGIEYVKTVIDEMTVWMEEHEYESVAQMRGSLSQKSVADPNSFLRGNYMKVLGSYTLTK